MPCGDDLCKHSSAFYPHSRIRADALCILLRRRGRSTRTLAFGFAGFWLSPPCLSGKAFCFPGLSGIRPIFLKLKAELCASTVLPSTRTREFALTRSAFCFAEYSLVNNARKGNVCFAAAIASLGRSPSALLGVGSIRRARPRKLSAFPDCRAFALSAKIV